ncbi:MAG: hypothetical protein PHX68_01275 [Alphaproteobacteria bacterium]|nr:hypothetical protein [Alphaproteobacteria bacterium]
MNADLKNRIKQVCRIVEHHSKHAVQGIDVETLNCNALRLCHKIPETEAFQHAARVLLGENKLRVVVPAQPETARAIRVGWMDEALDFISSQNLLPRTTRRLVDRFQGRLPMREAVVCLLSRMRCRIHERLKKEKPAPSAAPMSCMRYAPARKVCGHPRPPHGFAQRFDKEQVRS